MNDDNAKPDPWTKANFRRRLEGIDTVVAMLAGRVSEVDDRDKRTMECLKQAEGRWVDDSDELRAAVGKLMDEVKALNRRLDEAGKVVQTLLKERNDKR